MLYADTVEVLSLGNQMIRDVNKFAAGDATDLYALLTSLPTQHSFISIRTFVMWINGGSSCPS
jgi:hypothetical protein